MSLVIFSFAADARALERRLSLLERDQIPFALVKTANRLARQAVTDLQAEERQVFDRPTPYALSAWQITPSKSKRNPTAILDVKAGFGGGTPAWKFLGPEVFGGERRMKRFERALQATLGTGFAEPGRGAPLDQYGNISQGDVTRLMSALGAFSEQGYRANRRQLTARMRRAKTDAGDYKKAQYFLGHVGHDGEMLAIYQIVSPGKITPILVFSKKRPTYRQRLPYRQTVERTVKSNAVSFLAEELAKAIATAKPK